jgi:hypothetical protein
LPDKEEEDVKTERDLGLENIAGNLMIAEYQVDKLKLKQRLSQQVRYIGYGSFGSKKTSFHTFKYDDKWYKLSIKLEVHQSERIDFDLIVMASSRITSKVRVLRSVVRRVLDSTRKPVLIVHE